MKNLRQEREYEKTEAGGGKPTASCACIHVLHSMLNNVRTSYKVWHQKQEKRGYKREKRGEGEGRKPNGEKHIVYLHCYVCLGERAQHCSFKQEDLKGEYQNIQNSGNDIPRRTSTASSALCDVHSMEITAGPIPFTLSLGSNFSRARSAF
jgi:hypothetical protein